MRYVWATLLCLLANGAGYAQAPPGSLRLYFVDVEGGQATLAVTPSGEALLIDAGWDDADAARIAETARAAGVARIDALLVTHFHRDHAGGVAALAARMPIRSVYDHGENTERYKGSEELMAAYRKSLAGAKHTVVHPGDRLRVGGLEVMVITAGGKRIDKPLAGAGAANAVGGREARKPDEHTENEQSIGVLLRFGTFRMLDMADLLWNQELDLMCPVNRIGTADLLVVEHHGKDTSNSAAMIHAVRARAAIMNDGENKGGSPATFDVLRAAPGLHDLWELHYSAPAGNKNVEERLIANPRGPCKRYGITVTAGRDGSFRVVNERNHFQKEYRLGE